MPSAGFTAHPSHSEGVGRVVEPIWSYLRGKHDNATHRPLIDAIEDIRATFTPHCDPRDEDTPRTMTPRFVIATRIGEGLPDPEGAGGEADAESAAHVGFEEVEEHQAAQGFAEASRIAEQALAVVAYCHALYRRCSPHPPTGAAP